MSEEARMTKPLMVSVPQKLLESMELCDVKRKPLLFLSFSFQQIFFKYLLYVTHFVRC